MRNDNRNDDGDEIYFYQRAEQELELAQQASAPAAVKAHYMLASHYLDRVYGAEGETTAPSD